MPPSATPPPASHPLIAGQTYAFRAPIAVRSKMGEDSTPRRFEGVAYTGDVLKHPWFGALVIDLDSLDLPDRLPMLINHSGDQRAGWADKLAATHRAGLVIEGQLMDTEAGRQVGDESDQGFPWQMSVHVEPASIEEVQAGEKVKVNGTTSTGPLAVFRGSKIRETSFTPVGVDGGTSAHTFSAVGEPPAPPSPPEDDAMTETVETLTQQLAEANTRAETANTQLVELQTQFTEFRTQTRRGEITALFADVGMTFSDDAAKPYTDMTDAQFAAVSDQMRAMRNHFAPTAGGDAPGASGDAGAGQPQPPNPQGAPQPPAALFRETATNGDNGVQLSQQRSAALMGEVKRLSGQGAST